MNMRVAITVLLLSGAVNFACAQDQKSAEAFVKLLETYDYWKRASNGSGEQNTFLPLTELNGQSPILQQLKSCNRIHLDYGWQRRERDPMHEYTILELQFNDRTDIPNFNAQTIQLYQLCAGTSDLEDLTAAEKTSIFPVWEYRELVHLHEINWRYREYIKWHGIRYDNKVYILYTIPVANMDELDDHFVLFTEYIQADTETKIQDFITRLGSNKEKSHIAYESVKDLQSMLKRTGFNPGSVDGIYGSATEKALIALLVRIGCLDSNNLEKNQLREALKAFQGEHNLAQTGRCEKPTIDMLEKVWNESGGDTISLGTSAFRDSQKWYPRVRQAYKDSESETIKRLNAQQLEIESLKICIRVFKEEGKIELYGRNRNTEAFRLVKVYDICSSSGIPGPKRRQGDMQVPEGFYHIDRFNPHSSFYLSLGINYPNASDKVLGEKRNLGGDIFIHGSCVTIGCLPITDPEIKELYIFCVEARNGGQEKIPVTIFPAELNEKKFGELSKLYASDQDRLGLWADLRMAYDQFSETKRLPAVIFLTSGRHLLQ